MRDKYPLYIINTNKYSRFLKDFYAFRGVKKLISLTLTFYIKKNKQIFITK